MHDLVELGLYEHVTNRPPMPVEAALEGLASHHARRTYRTAIRAYLEWIERYGHEADPIVISNYRAELLSYLPPATVAVRLDAIRRLYQEAVAQGQMPGNPAASLAPPEVSPDPGCPAPSRQAAAARLAACRRDTVAGRRDYALCLLVAEGAVQPEEVQGLQVRDYRSEEGRGSLWVRRGEGDTRVRVELSAEVSQALEAYLAGREVADDSPLFGLPAPAP